ALTPSSTAWRLLRILHSLKPSRARRTSPGLSSTIRISTGVRGVLAFMSSRSVGLGNGEEKRGAVSGLRFDPDSPAVAFPAPLAQGQADASPRVLGRDVQPLKNDEDAIEIFWLDADAVVCHRKNPFAVALACVDMNARRLGTVKLDGVANQVPQ